MLESPSPGQAVPRAFLRIGGATLARHQLGVAQRMGCQRVICMARAASADLIALQHGAERAGMSFHILPDTGGLPGLVTAGDELLVLSEGLLADPDTVAGMLGEHSCVLVQPVEAALEAGFERIDLNFATAGIVLVPGHFAEKLRDLPADCDVASALTRIALQHGVTRKELSAALRSGARWQMIASENQAHAAESEWLKHVLADTGRLSPGFLVSRQAAFWIGPSLLHSRNGVTVLGLLVLVLLAFAAGMAWFALGAPALAVCAVAWLLLNLEVMLGRIEARLGRARKAASAGAVALDWLFDLVLVLILAWQTPRSGGAGLAGALFAPAMLVLVLRIAGAVFDGRPASLAKDRALACASLAVVAVSGMIVPFVQLFAIALAGLAIVKLGSLRQ